VHQSSQPAAGSLIIAAIILLSTVAAYAVGLCNLRCRAEAKESSLLGYLKDAMTLMAIVACAIGFSFAPMKPHLALLLGLCLALSVYLGDYFVGKSIGLHRAYLLVVPLAMLPALAVLTWSRDWLAWIDRMLVLLFVV
jgi:hypothetical protein